MSLIRIPIAMIRGRLIRRWAVKDAAYRPNRNPIIAHQCVMRRNQMTCSTHLRMPQSEEYTAMWMRRSIGTEQSAPVRRCDSTKHSSEIGAGRSCYSSKTSSLRSDGLTLATDAVWVNTTARCTTRRGLRTAPRCRSIFKGLACQRRSGSGYNGSA